MKDKIIEFEGKSYILKDIPKKVRDKSINNQGVIYELVNEEFVAIATKENHLVLIPYIKHK